MFFLFRVATFGLSAIWHFSRVQSWQISDTGLKSGTFFSKYFQETFGFSPSSVVFQTYLDSVVCPSAVLLVRVRVIKDLQELSTSECHNFLKRISLTFVFLQKQIWQCHNATRNRAILKICRSCQQMNATSI